jgi:hypothetical protein
MDGGEPASEGKAQGTNPTVNVALVHRQFAFLPGEICLDGGK